MSNAEGAHGAWLAVHLLFPLMLAVALQSRNVFGLPFAVFGLFKFGMPEVTGHILAGIYSTNCAPLVRACQCMNGVFLLIHHCMGLLSISGLASGLWVFSQPLTDTQYIG